MIAVIEEKPRCAEFSRGSDGRFLARYHGVRAPRQDLTFDKNAREVFVRAIVEHLPEGELLPIAEAAVPTGLMFDEFLSRFEQLCWWGLRRKEPWVELIAGYDHVAGCIVTPEGSWVIGRVGWKTRAPVASSPPVPVI